MKNPLRRTRDLSAPLQAAAGHLHARSARPFALPVGLAGGLGIGALLMYIFDPEQGRRRRAVARDQMASACRSAREHARVTLNDARHRTYGLYAEGRKRFGKRAVSDDILYARVRTKVGRYTRYAHAIDVSVNEGHVTLRGPVLTADADRLIAQVARLRGVQTVDDALQRYDQPGNIPALQGAYDARPMPAHRWTPTQRAAAGAAGTSLLVGGLLRRGGAGMALGALGAGLLAVGALSGGRRNGAPRPRPSL